MCKKESLFMCACVCLYERERERETHKDPMYVKGPFRLPPDVQTERDIDHRKKASGPLGILSTDLTYSIDLPNY